VTTGPTAGAPPGRQAVPGARCAARRRPLGLCRERARTFGCGALTIAPDAHVDVVVELGAGPARTRVVVEECDGRLVGRILCHGVAYVEDLPGQVPREPAHGEPRQGAGAFHAAATAGSRSSPTAAMAAPRNARAVIARLRSSGTSLCGPRDVGSYRPPALHGRQRSSAVTRRAARLDRASRAARRAVAPRCGPTRCRTAPRRSTSPWRCRSAPRSGGTRTSVRDRRSGSSPPDPSSGHPRRTTGSTGRSSRC